MSETILLAEINSLKRQLKQLISNQPKPRKTWVKASVITKLTGWDCEKMRQARTHDYVEYRKQDNKYEYLLESLNPLFIKKAAVGPAAIQ